MKQFSEIYEEVKQQIHKNTGINPTDSYIKLWIKEHKLLPEIKQEDLDKMYLIDQYLNLDIILYNDKKVESLLLVFPNDSVASIEDLLEAYEYEPIPESALEGCYLTLYQDNIDKIWTDIDPQILDDFIAQITKYTERP